jgi:hypothetical protein
LQQAVEIPNSAWRSVACFPNFGIDVDCNALKTQHFMFWHGSC